MRSRFARAATARAFFKSVASIATVMFALAAIQANYVKTCWASATVVTAPCAWVAHEAERRFAVPGINHVAHRPPLARSPSPEAPALEAQPRRPLLQNR